MRRGIFPIGAVSCIIELEFIFGGFGLNRIYLDNSATTMVCEQAAKKALEAMTETYGNPSSLHTMGFEAERELTAARQAAAELLDAREEEILFTSGGTESNNLALFGAAQAKRRDGRRIVTTAIEHPSVLRVMEQLEKQGFEVVRLRPDSAGHISPEQVEQAVTSDTILVSMMLVNNETGVRLPVESVAPAIRRANAPALFHVDAVQAFGKVPIRPGRLKIDLLSASSHKIHGPKGAGILYVREGRHIPPRTFGGGQEKDMRPGTEPMPAIAGFGAAVRALPSFSEFGEQMSRLNFLCREKLSQIPGIMFNSPEDAVPYILNFSVPGVRAETILHYLASRGVFVSSGSACAKAKPSHVLAAMGLGRARIQASLRVSLSRYNRPEDIGALADALSQGLAELAKRPL